MIGPSTSKRIARVLTVWACTVPSGVAAIGAVGLLMLDGSGPTGVFHVAPPTATAQTLLDAVARQDLAAAQAIVRSGVNPDATAGYTHGELTRGRLVQVTPLYVAIAQHDKNLIRMLIVAGASAESPENLAAVCIAARGGQLKILQVLKDSGADFRHVPGCGADNETPSQVARTAGHDDVAAFLDQSITQTAPAASVRTARQP